MLMLLVIGPGKSLRKRSRDLGNLSRTFPLGFLQEEEAWRREFQGNQGAGLLEARAAVSLSRHRVESKRKAQSDTSSRDGLFGEK